MTQSAISSVAEWRSSTASPTTQWSLYYENLFGDKHNVEGLLLWETCKWETSDISGGRNTLMDAVDQIYAGLPDEARTINAGADRNANLGLVVRFDYDYASKYMVQFSFRYDGSSKFYNKQWGFFPSFSVGWRISEENFIKNNFSFVDNIKIRASIGRLGDDNTSPYLWLMAFDYPGNDSYVLGKSGLIPGVGVPRIPNRDATWYVSTMQNIGLDFSLWKGALSAEIDFFRRKRSGLLTSREVSVPGTFGAGFAEENLNSDLQTGFEIALGHVNQVGTFSYQVKANVSFTNRRNLYVERAISGNSYDNWRDNVNDRNTNILWLYQSAGQYQNFNEIYSHPAFGGKYYPTQPLLPGDIKYVDYNEDGMIDEWDIQPIARNNTPPINFGLTIGAQWQGIDLSLLFQGAALFNARLNASPLQWSGSSWALFEDRWRLVNGNGLPDPFAQDGTWVSGRFPSTRVVSDNNYGISSTFWYRDCSYVRLKNIEIGYTLPQNWTKKVGVQSLRIFANGYNLLTIQNTDLDYIDPENPGGEINQYPIMRNYNFGINVTF